MDLLCLLLLVFCRLRQMLLYFSHAAPTLSVIFITIEAKTNGVGFPPRRKVILAACVSACENMGRLCCRAKAHWFPHGFEEEGEEHLPTALYSFLMNNSHH